MCRLFLLLLKKIRALCFVKTLNLHKKPQIIINLYAARSLRLVHRQRKMSSSESHRKHSQLNKTFRTRFFGWNEIRSSIIEGNYTYLIKDQFCFIVLEREKKANLLDKTHSTLHYLLFFLSGVSFTVFDGLSNCCWLKIDAFTKETICKRNKLQNLRWSVIYERCTISPDPERFIAIANKELAIKK